jgi:hypothetical protein
MAGDSHQGDPALRARPAGNNRKGSMNGAIAVLVAGLSLATNVTRPACR